MSKCFHYFGSVEAWRGSEEEWEIAKYVTLFKAYAPDIESTTFFFALRRLNISSGTDVANKHKNCRDLFGNKYWSCLLWLPLKLLKLDEKASSKLIDKQQKNFKLNTLSKSNPFLQAADVHPIKPRNPS